METFDEYLDRQLEPQIQAANERSRLRLLNEPHIVKAHYRRQAPPHHRLFSAIMPGSPSAPKIAQGLEHATTAQFNEVEISPSTFGLHFPLLDAQLRYHCPHARPLRLPQMDGRPSRRRRRSLTQQGQSHRRTAANAQTSRRAAPESSAAK